MASSCQSYLQVKQVGITTLRFHWQHPDVFPVRKADLTTQELIAWIRFEFGGHPGLEHVIDFVEIFRGIANEHSRTNEVIKLCSLIQGKTNDKGQLWSLLSDVSAGNRPEIKELIRRKRVDQKFRCTECNEKMNCSACGNDQFKRPWTLFQPSRWTRALK